MSLALESHPPSVAVDLLGLMREPAYMRLMGEGIAIGVGLGTLARVSPRLVAPVAFVAGIYYTLDLLAFIEDQERRHEPPILEAVVVADPELEQGDDGGG